MTSMTPSSREDMITSPNFLLGQRSSIISEPSYLARRSRHPNRNQSW